MKNKGFTMIELLAVFTVIGLILIMAIPQITSLLKTSNTQEYETFLDSIYIACEGYINDQNIEITNQYEVSIKKLIETGFLKSTLINPENNLKLSDEKNMNKIILITKNEDNVLEYELQGE